MAFTAEEQSRVFELKEQILKTIDGNSMLVCSTTLELVVAQFLFTSFPDSAISDALDSFKSDTEELLKRIQSASGGTQVGGVH